MSEQTANRKLTSGEWSAVEVITHVKDADGVLNQRVKLLLDQDNPSLEFQAVFEWAESRREASSISDILEAYMKSREETLQRLTDLPFANWWRRGQHQEFQCIAQGKEDHPEGSSENAGRSSVELDQGEIGEVETHG